MPVVFRRRQCENAPIIRVPRYERLDCLPDLAGAFHALELVDDQIAGLADRLRRQRHTLVREYRPGVW
jgi:hypothetical protein